MGNRLYVGNLPYSMRDARLAEVFGEFGSVLGARVMMERESGRSKGFGFVEMANEAQAHAAISALHGKVIDGRDLVVNKARPLGERPAREGASSLRSPYGTQRRSSNTGHGSGASDGYGGLNGARQDGTFRSPYGYPPRTRGAQQDGSFRSPYALAGQRRSSSEGRRSDADGYRSSAHTSGSTNNWGAEQDGSFRSPYGYNNPRARTTQPSGGLRSPWERRGRRNNAGRRADPSSEWEG